MLIDLYQNMKRVLIGYQFHFGVGIHNGDKILDCLDNHPCALKSISNECYRISKDITNRCSRQPDRQIEGNNTTDKFIANYKKNVARRIRTTYRGIRDSLVIKLDSFPLSSLTIDKKIINSQNIEMSGIVTIQSIGVATISLWIEGYTPKDDIEWLNICDPAVISFTLTHVNLSRPAWRLSEFVRYLALKCHQTLNEEINIPSSIENNDIIINEGLFVQYLRNEYSKCKEKPISYHIEAYPIVFIYYNLETSALNTMFSNPNQIADARLVLNGDSHWQLKTEEVIASSVCSVDVATRNSVHWLVAPQGTLKVCSLDLENETSVEESFNVALFETDLVLTMRYFLTAIMQSLSELTKEINDPIKVSDMKDHIFITMDKYFNIDISQNDQTIKRIETFKNISC